MSKAITTEVRLPKKTIDEVKAIAKLAGLSPESVIKLALATEVRRWQKVGAGDTAVQGDMLLPANAPHEGRTAALSPGVPLDAVVGTLEDGE